MTLRRGVVALAACAPLVCATSAGAQEAASWFSLHSELKSTGYFARSPADPELFPDRGSAEGLWRFRLEPTIRLADAANIEIAVEPRARVFSSESTVFGVLSGEGDAPYRIRQLDWQLGSAGSGDSHLEIDRAALHAKFGTAELTVGRQAIGWGRGVLFGAVDLFAPFAPLEPDREWRRGVDAARAEIRLADRISLDAVSAFGADLDHSAFAGRLRGYAGKADVELVGGWRARDVFAGATTSAAVKGAELHAEIAAFRTPAVPGSAAFGGVRTIVKAVAGGSYRLAVKNGILVFVEYHYSGFGAASAAGIVPLLTDPVFQERFLRGDTQILERHAAAVMASYEFSPEWSASFQWLQSPVDGSSVAVPAATLTFSDTLSLLMSGYVPVGRVPVGLALQSVFGAYPLAAFVQLRYYR